MLGLITSSPELINKIIFYKHNCSGINPYRKICKRKLSFNIFHTKQLKRNVCTVRPKAPRLQNAQQKVAKIASIVYVLVFIKKNIYIYIYIYITAVNALIVPYSSFQ